MRTSSLVAILFILLLSGCEGCSKSAQRSRLKGRISEGRKENVEQHHSTKGEKTVISMQKINGVFEIPVEVNGVNMNFIFDTGASDITISATEAIFLIKQGTLKEEDILGSQYYQIADGSITEGTIINLRTVKLGDKILYNVKASIVHSMEAPILLGQSALSQFGKVSIDYNLNQITFE